MIASGALLDTANKYGKTPLYRASENGHLEIVKVLIADKANFLQICYGGQSPLDVADTKKIKKFIMNHPWYRRRPLLLTRPHTNHQIYKTQQLTPLGPIITAKKSSALSSQDDVLLQIKMKIASFL